MSLAVNILRISALQQFTLWIQVTLVESQEMGLTACDPKNPIGMCVLNIINAPQFWFLHSCNN